jgi:hypothetical protein
MPASPELVRKVLMKLLGAKGKNIGAQEGVGTIDPQGKFVPPDPAQAARDLRQARQQAREVQGTDPLRKFVNPKGDLTDLGESDNQIMARQFQHMDQPEDVLDELVFNFTRKKGREPTPEEMQDLLRIERVQELTESDYFINEFERLTDRTPTAEELADPAGIRRVVETLQQGDANIGRLDLDDVPF